jgi:hypothetical protein
LASGFGQVLLGVVLEMRDYSGMLIVIEN